MMNWVEHETKVTALTRADWLPGRNSGAGRDVRLKSRIPSGEMPGQVEPGRTKAYSRMNSAIAQALVGRVPCWRSHT